MRTFREPLWNLPMTVRDLSRKYRVHVSASVCVPLSASAVWGQMRDFSWFTTLDPFHVRVRVIAPSYQPGAKLVIEHRFLGIGFKRVGRILKWTEGLGYCFSDLSASGIRNGFPHVYCYRVQSVDEHTTRISVSVRGRWTATLFPRWLIKLWLRFVMANAGARIRLAMWAHYRYLAKPSRGSFGGHGVQ